MRDNVVCMINYLIKWARMIQAWIFYLGCAYKKVNCNFVSYSQCTYIIIYSFFVPSKRHYFLIVLWQNHYDFWSFYMLWSSDRSHSKKPLKGRSVLASLYAESVEAIMLTLNGNISSNHLFVSGFLFRLHLSLFLRQSADRLIAIAWSDNRITLLTRLTDVGWFLF